MRISHKHHFIWISKPKTGSVSYRALLDPYSDVISTPHPPFHHHTTLRKLKEIFHENGWDFNSYFKICPVRNPWNLLLSLYVYSRTDVNGVKFWDKKRQHDPTSLMGFEEWISLDSHHDWFRKLQPLSVYARGNDNEMLADLVFATDRDNQVFFNEMLTRCKLQLDSNDLHRLNTTTKPIKLLEQASLYFSTAHIKKMMADIFWEEIKLFGYENPF